MSEQWGRTGRVTLWSGSGVWVDDRYVGLLFDSSDRPGMWYAAISTRSIHGYLHSRDDAIMWVLRRAAPDVWRAERPVVYRVWRDAERLPVDAVWLSASNGSAVSWSWSWKAAMASAERRARADYAGMVTR